MHAGVAGARGRTYPIGRGRRQVRTIRCSDCRRRCCRRRSASRDSCRRRSRPLGLGTAGAGRYSGATDDRRRRVHESDSFISEVSEAVRRDRLTRALRRYGWLIGAAVILIVGGRRGQRVAQGSGPPPRPAASRRRAARRLCRDRPGDAGRRARATSRSAQPDAAVLARLARGRKPRRCRRHRRAPRRCSATSPATASVSELYRSLASLQRVMLLGPAMDAAERQATLELLAADGAPFRPLALEQRALMHLEPATRRRRSPTSRRCSPSPAPPRRCAAGRGS